MKFGLRYEFTWKCMYAGWICYLRNYGLLLCSYSNALNEYPISSSLSHDDCCVYPHPEKVRIQHSQTWPAFSVVEYQQELSHGPLSNILGKLFLSLLGALFRCVLLKLCSIQILMHLTLTSGSLALIR
ncbi:unnamed protein product [Malus baccata var. baccata]